MEPAARAARNRMHKTLFIPLLALAFVCLFVLEAYSVFRMGVYILAAGILIAAVLFILALRAKTTPNQLALLFVVAICIAFSWGYQEGHFIRHPRGSDNQITTTIVTMSYGTIDARLIRSGDRGVLFVDSKNNQVTLLQWDEIKQISTADGP